MLVLCITLVGSSAGQMPEHNKTPGRNVPSTSLDVGQLLAAQRYDDLDHAIDAARSQKTRGPGGVWQLYLIYEAIHKAAKENFAVLEQVQKWAAARPESTAARIALAEAYVAVGFKSRGTGDADSVTDAGWKDLTDNGDRAVATLKQLTGAGGDPHVSFVLMEIALAQGWDKATTRQIYERALAAEPAYYHIFRQYALYLLPKWYGEGTSAEDMAEDLYRRVGGKEGLFLYFEVGTVIGCDCGRAPLLERMSWERVKAGYEALQELYGATNRDHNRFALLAFAHGDKPAARAAFKSITAFDPDVWNTQLGFEKAKGWALQPEKLHCGAIDGAEAFRAVDCECGTLPVFRRAEPWQAALDCQVAWSLQKK
jgi:hypothetical protein